MQSSKMSQNLQMLTYRCSQTKQVISLFSIIFAVIQNAISEEPIAQSTWVFHQIEA